MLFLPLVLLLAGCAALQPARSRQVRLHADIEFDAHRALALDIYAPRDAHAAPVVVFFYGGSWLGGERGWYRFVGQALAAHGVIAVIPDYRKLPEVELPGFMRDAARAVGWVHAHIAAYGGDPQRLYLMGHSSGGHIAALLATDPRWLAAQGLLPSDLAGCIGLAGVYAFLPADVGDDEMLGAFGTTPAQWRAAEPIAYVVGQEPPMLLLSGTDDDEVDPDNSRVFAAALRARGDRVELHLYPEIGHSRILLALARPRDAHAPTLHDVLAFIAATAPLGASSPAIGAAKLPLRVSPDQALLPNACATRDDSKPGPPSPTCA